jgi:hypothetical protein
VVVQHDTPHREALAVKVDRLGTELADCLAESYSIGHEASDCMFGALLDHESWARELRGDPHGPTAILAQQARERRVAALDREDDDQGDDLAAVIPLPVVGEPEPRLVAALRSLGLKLDPQTERLALALAALWSTDNRRESA